MSNHIERGPDSIERLSIREQAQTIGTTQLFNGDKVVLIPTPSSDRNDPLNLPTYRKWIILVLVTAYASTAAGLATGMGAIFPFVRASYPNEALKANDLMTYPALFMGIGNFISMPLALTVGRRPVFLFSVTLLAGSGLWCAMSKSLASHIAGRNVLSMAAGQSEALVPMMVGEIFFLHERSRAISWFISLQNVLLAAIALSTTYITASIGWKMWYGIYSAVNLLILILSWFFVFETGYNRSESALAGQEEEEVTTIKERDSKHLENVSIQATSDVSSTPRPVTQWQLSDLHLVTKRNIQWSEIPLFYKHFLQGCAVPAVLWLLLLNGAFLSMYVFQASTFAQTLLAPPYSFAFESLGFVQAAQVIVTLIFLPLLGYGGDWIIKTMSKRRNGVYDPEYRLLPLWIPAIIGIVCAIFYGQAAAHPHKYSNWATIAITYNATFFGFLGANVIGIVYCIDSFPARAGPVLVVICAGRGLISFGMAYATLPAISTIGYDGAMIAEASICAGLSLFAIPVYLYGRQLRLLAEKWFGFGKAVSRPDNGASAL